MFSHCLARSDDAVRQHVMCVMLLQVRNHLPVPTQLKAEGYR